MFRTTKSAESTTSTKASRRGTLPFGFNIKTSFFQSPSSSQTTLVSVGQAGQQDKSAEQSPQHLAVHEAHPHGGAAGPSQEHVQQHAQSQSHSGRRHSREAREGGSQQASRQSTPLPLIPQPLLPVQTAQQPPQMAHQPTLGKRPSLLQVVAEAKEKEKEKRFRVRQSLFDPLKLVGRGSDEKEGDVVEDDEYFLEDVVFQVEDRLFKVPRYAFEHNSEYFRTLFSIPPQSKSASDGSSKTHPIVLPGIKKDDFKLFLTLLYPRDFDGSRSFKPNYDEGVRLLELASTWKFSRVRKFLIGRMTPILESQPVNRLVLGIQYHVDQWVKSGIDELIKRDKPLDMREGDWIGVDTTAKIGAIRECCAQRRRQTKGLFNGGLTVPHTLYCAKAQSELGIAYDCR